MPTVRCSACGRRVTFRGLAATCSCGNVVSAAGEEVGSATDFSGSEFSPAYNSFDEPAPFIPPARPFRRKRNKLWPVLIVCVGALCLLFIAVELVRRQIDQRDAATDQSALSTGTSSGARPVVPESAPLPAVPPPPVLPEPAHRAEPEPVKTQPQEPEVPRPLYYELTLLQPEPAPSTIARISDAQVQSAINKGIDYLISSFNSGVLSKIDARSEPRPIGEFALAAYALLHAGHATSDPRLGPQGPLVRTIIEKLKQLPMDREFPTYSRSIRLAALAVYNRREDRTAMHQDLKWLQDAILPGGGYSYLLYSPEERATRMADNSNSQYGVLGVWAAADAGLPVPVDYWKLVESHWLKSQNSDGGWAYDRNQSQTTFTMTCAGITTLFVIRDQIRSSERAAPPSSEIERGMEALIRSDYLQPRRLDGYALFGLERTALATGYKYFGNFHWYHDNAAFVVQRQRGDGSWEGHKSEGDLVRTAFSLLFLARGQSPMFINKLRFDGTWQRRPRDVAGLTAFASKQLERPLNWQIVDITHNWRDWMDSPVLYITSHQKIDWTEEQLQKMRSYANAGGLIYTQADSGAKPFTQFIESMAGQLFPEYRLQPIPEDHPIYNIVFRIKNKPPLLGISNGTRLLLVHSPTDTTQLREVQSGRTFRLDQELAVNIGVYASGKQDLHRRLDSPVVAPPASKPKGTVPLARLRYDGNWDPEPMAWERMNNIMRNQTSIAVAAKAVDVEALRYEQTPLAHLTGTGKYPLTDPIAIRRFVEAGGVLLIDPAGGDAQFLQSVVDRVLPIAFPGEPLLPLDDQHPVISGSVVPGTVNLTKPLLRPYAIETVGRNVPPLRMLRFGKGAIIVSDLDVTTGILGAYTWGINGYQPDYAEKLVRNVILWSIKGENRPH